MIAGLALLLGTLAPALAAAGGLGAIVGAATCSSRPPGRIGQAGAWLAAASFGAACAIAFAAWLPGRPGLWLEIALLCVAAYALGCGLGCGIGRLVSSRMASRRTA